MPRFMVHTGCPEGPFMMTQVVLGDHLCRGPVNSLQYHTHVLSLDQESGMQRHASCVTDLCHMTSPWQHVTSMRIIYNKMAYQR